MTIAFGSQQAQEVVAADKAMARETKKITETIECHKCRATVELEYETEEWEKHGDIWKHSSYGPGVGYCEHCHILFCDSWDGLTAYYEKRKR